MDLSVRPAQQRRTKESWSRVLDAGVAVLTEDGRDGFTIAAVCKRAGVSAPTIYRRTPNKDALFLAVYEHGISGIRATEERITTQLDLTGERAAIVRTAVGAVAELFLEHRDFLRAVIVISATNEVVRSRGVDASNALAVSFERLTSPARLTDKDRDAVFQMVFAALVLRTGFGPDFAMRDPVSDQNFVRALENIAAAALT